MSTCDLILSAQSMFRDMMVLDAAERAESSFPCSDERLQLWDAQHATSWLHLTEMMKSKRHLAFVFDIEGTTTPLPFVTKILYPQSERHLSDFLSGALLAGDVGVTQAVEQAAATDTSVASAVATGDSSSVGCALERHLRQLISENSKAPYLKYVQGRIWDALYNDGIIKGHVFDDAVRCLMRWGAPNTQRAGQSGDGDAATSVWIYSSGSIPAQKLLFKFSSSGDLTAFISGYFDPTTVGPKTDKASYNKIRMEIAGLVTGGNTGVDSNQLGVVFFTDHLGEVSAARSTPAIDAVVFVTRPLNNTERKESVQDATADQLNAARVLSISSFDQMSPDGKGNTNLTVPVLLRGIAAEVAPYQQASGPLKSFL